MSLGPREGMEKQPSAWHQPRGARLGQVGAEGSGQPPSQAALFVLSLVVVQGLETPAAMAGTE